MTRGSIREYTEAVRQRYLRASKKGKGSILDEFVNVTGYHRKSAIRLFHRKRQVVPRRRRGRARQYDVRAVEALRVAWEVTDRICSRRLQPFLPELIKVLRRYGEKLMTAEVEVQLCQMSPSTIDRLLRPYRRLGGRRPFSTTKPGSLLKHSIPISTFADWEENRPGFLEVDLVAHCGESAEGFLPDHPVYGGCSHRLVGMCRGVGKEPDACRRCRPRSTTALTVPPLRIRLG